MRTIRWPGAKTASGKVGKWLLDLLPVESGQCYAELFGGSANILLAREPVMAEILNDREERIGNFFAVCRDRRDELAERWLFTEWSQSVYEMAWDLLDDDDELVAAWAFIVRCQLSGNLANPLSSKSRGYLVRRNNGITATAMLDFAAIAERLREVQLSSKDAVWHLVRLADKPHALIYLDPPYHSGEYVADQYEHHPDIDTLGELMLAQSGKVAVSGYGEEWDMLGWEKHTCDTYSSSYNGRNHRVETLWTNYTPDKKPI